MQQALVLEGTPDVHLVNDVRIERGMRVIHVRCGVLLSEPTSERARDWTVWESLVTCGGCQL